MESIRQPKESSDLAVVSFLKKHEPMMAQIAKKYGLNFSDEIQKKEIISAAFEAYNDTIIKMRRRQGVKFENVLWFYLQKRIKKIHSFSSLFHPSYLKDKPKCPKCGSKNIIPASPGWATCQNVKCNIMMSFAQDNLKCPKCGSKDIIPTSPGWATCQNKQCGARLRLKKHLPSFNHRVAEPFSFSIKPSTHKMFSLDAPMIQDDPDSSEDITGLNVIRSEPLSDDGEDGAITADVADTAEESLSTSFPYSFDGLEGHIPIDAMHTLHVLTCDVQPNGKERKEYMADAMGINKAKFYLQVKKAIAEAKKSTLTPFKVIVLDSAGDTNKEAEKFVWDVKGGHNIPLMKRFEGKKILKIIPLYNHAKSESKNAQQLSFTT